MNATPVSRFCRTCGASFVVPAWVVRKGNGWYCSPPCAWMAKRAPRSLLNHPTDPTALLVPLTRGMFATIDREDAALVRDYRWRVLHTQDDDWYAITDVRLGPGARVFLLLHRIVLGAADGVLVDHEDGNGLNCRRSNIRECSETENRHNTGMLSTNTSGFKGVSWYKATGRWMASICINYRHQFLGYFDDPTEAAHAYDDAVRQTRNPRFIRVNFPRDGERGVH